MKALVLVNMNGVSGRFWGSGLKVSKSVSKS